MIQFACPECEQEVTTADEHAGKKGRCPSCRAVFAIPGGKASVRSAAPPAPARRPAPPPEEEVEEAEEALPTAAEEDEAISESPRKPLPARGRRAADEDEEESPRKRRPSRDEEEDELEEVEDRPRKRKKRGPYADCPECGCRGHATKVSFTWWGGFVGPALFSHVKCDRCGTCYNGKHGDYNTTRIAIYVGIGFAIAIALIVVRVAMDF
jgi:hypothetical protein